MIRELSLAVVGAAHPNKRGPSRSFGIALCRPGDSIELRPEPDNPADEWAIAVIDERGIQIGYLASERAPYISKMMSMGHDLVAIFQARTERGAVVRVAFNGEQPSLPPLRDKRDRTLDGIDNDPIFEADSDWSDD